MFLRVENLNDTDDCVLLLGVATIIILILLLQLSVFYALLHHRSLGLLLSKRWTGDL